MNKVLLGVTIFTVLFGSANYYGSTTAPVVIAGAIIKASTVEPVKKFKRKDCPVCEGKGWYMSGDKIKKVECGYCEPDKGQNPGNSASCPDGKCQTQFIKK